MDGRNRALEKKKCKATNSSSGGAGDGSGREGMFESGHVAVLDADWLLVKLILAYDDDDGTAAVDGDDGKDESHQNRTDAPTIARYVCRCFYLHEEKNMLHLFDRGVDGMRTRGIEYAHIMKRDNELRKRTTNT